MHYTDGPRPRLFAHRGGSLEAPENTIEAFRHGLEAGCDRLELDIHAAADGELVVIHDPTLERTTDGTGEVRHHTLARLREFDAGARFLAADGSRPFAGRGLRIPSFAEVLEAFPHVALNVEIKQSDPPMVQATFDLLAHYGARSRVLLAAEHDDIMAEIRARDPGGPTGASTGDVLGFIAAWGEGRLASWRAPGLAFQSPPEFNGSPVVTGESLARMHAAGLEVHVWTIDDAAEMDRLLDLGIDGIMTDRPTLAAEVFRRRGLR